jgi:hypothetical protein
VKSKQFKLQAFYGKASISFEAFAKDLAMATQVTTIKNATSTQIIPTRGP